MTNENIKVWISKMKDLLPEQATLIPTLENLNLFITAFNPALGIIIQTALNNTKFNHSEKLEDRLAQIMETINVILEKQKSYETNYEATLICPELFKQVLIMEDKERVNGLTPFFRNDKIGIKGSLGYDKTQKVWNRL